MKKVFFIALVFSSYFCIADNDREKTKYFFEQIKELEFQVLDTNFSNDYSFTLWNSYYDSLNQKVYAGNYFQNQEIFRYFECDFKTAELKSIKIPYPDSLKRPDSFIQFKWLSSGNFCLISNRNNHLLIYSLDGKLINDISIDFLEKENKDCIISPFENYLVNETKLYLQTSPSFYSIGDSERKKIFNLNYGLCINLSDKIKYTPLKIKYPTKYQNNNSYYNNNYSITINNLKQIVCSFRCSDSLYVYNDKNYEFKAAFYAGSDLNPHFKPFIKGNEAKRSEVEKYALTEPYYEKILFDPYKKMYYRFYYDRLKFDKEAIKKPLISEKKQSVIILDENFNRLGEVIFGNKEMHPCSISIPTKEGLLNVCDWGPSGTHPSRRKFTLNWMRFKENNNFSFNGHLSK
ncbi:MAG: DUF4221 family protein [Bacteroidales bacterium]